VITNWLHLAGQSVRLLFALPPLLFYPHLLAVWALLFLGSVMFKRFESFTNPFPAGTPEQPPEGLFITA